MSENWIPAPIAVAHPSLFSKSELDAFDREILTNRNATETDASDFFARIPKFLYLGRGDEVRREVVLVTDASTSTRRVDFFRRSYIRGYWDIIEIKDPQKPFVVADNTRHPRLSAEVDKAINQAQDYRDLIERDAFLRDELLRSGISVWRPQIVVIVGKHECRVPPEVLDVLLDRVHSRGPIEAWSYDDIFLFAQQHYRSNRTVIVNHFLYRETQQSQPSDITILCVDCHLPFLFSEAEQEFYSSKNLSPPQRCTDCRSAHEHQRFAAREMHKVACDKCGAECEIPFKPRPVEDGGRPVLCRDCFVAQRQAERA
jgi:CxxC-x17-CxxC domain-containing protein